MQGEQACLRSREEVDLITNKETCLVLWFDNMMSLKGLCVGILGPQLGVLFGETLRPLGSMVYLEEGSHQEAGCSNHLGLRKYEHRNACSYHMFLMLQSHPLPHSGCHD